VRTQLPLLLLLGGCDGDEGKGKRPNQNKPIACNYDDDCPNRSPWCCPLEGNNGNQCFQWRFIAGGDEVCANDECEVNADCARGYTCCDLESVAGVPLLACAEDGEVYETPAGYTFSCE
jgi:hypothetical protein